MLESFFLLKLQSFRIATLLKRDSNTVVSCECCEIFKINFFCKTLPVAASTGASSKRGKEKHFIKRKIKISLNISLFESCFIKLRPITCNFVKIECPLQVFCSELCEISQNNFTRYSIERPLLDVKRSCGK